MLHIEILTSACQIDGKLAMTVPPKKSPPPSAVFLQIQPSQTHFCTPHSRPS
ncbi:hypothetical protein [Rubritalea tangerina]|uniref:hypothetical protein n=1 Tax=Rubritalea tangerina TaxID=430798 RepID=UPI00360AC4D9